MSLLHGGCKSGWMEHMARILFFMVPVVFDDDDWFGEMFLFLLQIEDMFEEAKDIDRVPQRTSILQGDAFVQEVLSGHPGTWYEFFRM